MRNVRPFDRIQVIDMADPFIVAVVFLKYLTVNFVQNIARLRLTTLGLFVYSQLELRELGLSENRLPDSFQVIHQQR